MDPMDPLRNIPRLSELSGHLPRLSTTDRGTFSTLTSVSDIQEWTRAKVDEHRQYALALLTIHNLAAPIHCLPTEVLERIFAHCWHDRKSLRLSHVCSLWRSIILGRVAFWADAMSNCGPLFDKRQVPYDELPFIDTLLSRSACHSRGISPFFHGFTPNIVKSLTPYIHNVVSLRVDLNRKSDLYEGLWPVLRSGMPKLDSLGIALMDSEDDGDDEDSDFDDLEWDLEENPLTILSHETLPQLCRVTCPTNMVRFFGGVPLKHINIAGGSSPGLDDFDQDDTPRRHLEPYRGCLETLEITGEVVWDVARPAGTEALRFSCLRDLRIVSRNPIATSAILSWLALPQTAHIHITDCDARLHPHFQRLFSSEDNTALHSVVGITDHVSIRCPRSSWWLGDHTMLCFAGNTECLRLDHYRVVSDGLNTVFGSKARVTRLTLSLASAKDVLEIDFRAFPHLVHLDMTSPDMDDLARMLGPTNKLRGRPATPKPALCPALAALAITCGLAVHWASAPPPKSTGRAKKPKADPTSVDEVFQQRCSILQRVLARRASSGTRLTELALRLRPATILGRPKQPGGGGSAEPDPVWPSPAARQSVLESLQELVDGPVVLRLLDGAEVEVTVDEVEAEV